MAIPEVLVAEVLEDLRVLATMGVPEEMVE
jgi:hypothetical protein